jgi:hypothetical protein
MPLCVITRPYIGIYETCKNIRLSTYVNDFLQSVCDLDCGLDTCHLTCYNLDLFGPRTQRSSLQHLRQRQLQGDFSCTFFLHCILWSIMSSFLSASSAFSRASSTNYRTPASQSSQSIPSGCQVSRNSPMHHSAFEAPAAVLAPASFLTGHAHSLSWKFPAKAPCAVKFPANPPGQHRGHARA